MPRLFLTERFVYRANLLDRTEIGKNIPVALALVGDARALTARLTERLRPRDCDAWRAEIATMARERTEAYRGDMAPDAILAGIREVSGPGTTVVSDVGQHQMWVAKLFGYQERNSHITSGGLGTFVKVNGERQLKAQDRIRVGQQTLQVEQLA